MSKSEQMLLLNTFSSPFFHLHVLNSFLYADMSQQTFASADGQKVKSSNGDSGGVESCVKRMHVHRFPAV